VAEASRRPPGQGSHGGGPKEIALGGDRGQPERQDHGKRGPRGYDAGKKIKGRKRHLVVDTLGLILAVVVHSADVQDRDGAKLVLQKLRGLYPRLKKIWADGGYAGKLVAWTQSFGGWVLEIVKRSDAAVGFTVLPKRWIVERTFGWLGRYRRMSKDYESLPQSSENMIYLAMINLMVHRLQPG
jgi:putative transposase